MDMGLLTTGVVDVARAEADQSGEGVLDTLVSKGELRSADVASAKAAQFGVEYIPLGEMKLTDDVIAAVPRHVAKKFNVVPVYKTDTGVVVAIADPSDLDVIDGLQHERLMVRALCAQSLYEESRNRFGYVPGGSQEERALAVERWRDWWISQGTPGEGLARADGQ